MTKKTYIILAESLSELRESGFTSGAMVKRLTDKFVEIVNRRMKERFINYKEEKFIKKIYGK